jgi:hypothetical protein
MADSLLDWLALREQADFESRSTRVTDAVIASMPKATPLRVLDLGTGRGSNVRYLMPRLPRPQHWLAVDRGRELLDDLQRRIAPMAAEGGHSVQTREMNIATLPPEIFAGRHLVTMSALIDLVSEAWLGQLARRCADAGAAVLIVITYNGRSSVTPAEPEDGLVLELFNRHQRTDKGIGGAAAGPGAHAAAAHAFREAGYEIVEDDSDWVLGPEFGQLQRELIEGWAHAATEMAPDRRAEIAAWLARRLAHVEADGSRVRVGHHDLGAWPRA